MRQDLLGLSMLLAAAFGSEYALSYETTLTSFCLTGGTAQKAGEKAEGAGKKPQGEEKAKK